MAANRGRSSCFRVWHRAASNTCYTSRAATTLNMWLSIVGASSSSSSHTATGASRHLHFVLLHERQSARGARGLQSTTSSVATERNERYWDQGRQYAGVLPHRVAHKFHGFVSPLAGHVQGSEADSLYQEGGTGQTAMHWRKRAFCMHLNVTGAHTDSHAKQTAETVHPGHISTVNTAQ